MYAFTKPHGDINMNMNINIDINIAQSYLKPYIATYLDLLLLPCLNNRATMPRQLLAALSNHDLLT